MAEVKRIADQLKRAYEGQAWHGPSLKELLAGVTAEQAAARPVAEAHSIWEITLHISAWESAAIERLKGRYVEEPDEGDWPAVEDASESAWQGALAKVESKHMTLRDAIANLDDDKLKTPLAEGKQSAYYLLHGVIQHTLYHAGQIALLKRAGSF